MLIGQANAETQLARAAAAGRAANAYLFLGPPNCGKTLAAMEFASALNCAVQPAVQEGGGRLRLAPCGECESCRRIAAGKHPEVLVIHPGTGKGQNVGVDQARELRQNASLRPKLGRRRVYVLPTAEALSEEAANCLLKTLEEPASFLTLILAAPNPAQVLPTVRSRCRIVRFGLAPREEVEAALRERGTEPVLAAVLARSCGGRPGLAFQWAGRPEVLERRRRLLGILTEALSLQPAAGADPSQAVQSLRLAALLAAETEGDERPARAVHQENLEVLLGGLRDRLVLASGGAAELVQNAEILEANLPLASPERAVSDLEAAREAGELLERNVGAGLVFERMFWRLIAGPV